MLQDQQRAHHLCFRLTGVEAMGKVVQAWSSGNLYPDIPPALSKINNAGIKVRTLLLPHSCRSHRTILCH
jgi:hypothetical protein